MIFYRQAAGIKGCGKVDLLILYVTGDDTDWNNHIKRAGFHDPCGFVTDIHIQYTHFYSQTLVVYVYNTRWFARADGCGLDPGLFFMLPGVQK